MGNAIPPCCAEERTKSQAAFHRFRMSAVKCGFLLLGCLPNTSAAADLRTSVAAPAPAVPVESGWRFSASAYVWALRFSGEVRTLPPLPTVDVDLSFGDILEKLDGALMSSVEARFHKFILFGDLIFTRIGLDRSFSPLGIPVNLSVASTSFIGIAAGGYRVFDHDGLTVDAFVGARAFAVDSEISLNAPQAGIRLTSDEAWLDAVGGARIRYDFNRNWFIHAIGFAGAGASKYNWDVYGGVGYAFNANWASFVGYRALKVNYRKGYFIYDVLQQGPVLGVTYRF